MKKLPVHLKMGLPIPVINTFSFGKHDFTTINGELSTALAQRNRCGICSERMTDEAAFLGGGKSADTRAYTDPPMHPACALAAVQMCPHINRKDMKRAPDHRLQEGVMTPAPMSLAKPESWVMLVVAVDDYEITLAGKGDDKFIMYVPGAAVRRREWVYNDEGQLVSVDVSTGEVDL
jgi:hypothetical protein